MKKLSVFIFFLLTTTAAYSNESDNASWWIENHGVTTSREDPLVERAEKVFALVTAAADKKGNRFPRLVIIHGGGEPWAQAIRDGSVILTQGALQICYAGVTQEKGDSRLAFILGHELAHLAKDDFWHSSAFAAIKKDQDENKGRKALLSLFEKTSDVGQSNPMAIQNIKIKELQADSYGLIYMAMAGFDPKSVVEQDKTNFFDEWVSRVAGEAAYGDPSHPGPEQRAVFLRSQLRQVANHLSYFTFGVRLYQLGRYSDALLLLETFKDKFPGREVLNNIGLCHYQLAMGALAQCDKAVALQFKISTALDMETLGADFLTRGNKNTSHCRQDKAFISHINEAIHFLNPAINMDPAYLPARINLSSALIMAGKYSEALGVLDEALKINSADSMALNNKAVALYLFGLSSSLNTADNSLEILRTASANCHSCSELFYNMASIQARLGRNAAATDNWRAFLDLESTGAFAQAARERLGSRAKRESSFTHLAGLESPFPLGEMNAQTTSLLKGFERRELSIGDFSGEIFEDKDFKILAIDRYIEVVEKNLTESLPFNEFTAKSGAPVRVFESGKTQTFLYNDSGMDVMEGEVKKIFYFKKN